MTVATLRKFGEAVLVDYTWWRDIEARHRNLQIKFDDKYEEARYCSFVTEWTRLRKAYTGYQREVCVQAAVALLPVTE